MRGLLELPRTRLATLPTPLQPAPRLSAALGVEIWLKRDDLTGHGLGGNKVRALEYLIGGALDEGCDCLVTGAGPQSNWALLAAVAARRCGLDPFLVFYGSPERPSGNLLLDGLLDADIRYTGELERSSVDPAIEKLAGQLAADGRTPCLLPRGGATAVGSVGYVLASLELAGQLVTAELAPSYVWLPTGSCGTQSGLVAGARWLRASYEVVGVAVSRAGGECRDRIRALADGAARLLGLGIDDGAGPRAADPTVLEGYLGPGYGIPTPEGAAATRLVAGLEGVFLDPVFGAKAMAALIDAAKAGRIDGPVVFLVTGGAPSLFTDPKGSMV